MFLINMSPVPPQIKISGLYSSTCFFINSISSLVNLSITEFLDLAFPGVFFKLITEIRERYFLLSILFISSTVSKSILFIMPALNLETLFQIHPPTAPSLKNSVRSYPTSSSFSFVSFKIKVILG